MLTTRYKSHQAYAGLLKNHTYAIWGKKAVKCFPGGFFLDFVRRSGTTRAEGPHGGASHVRGAKQIRIGRRPRFFLPLPFSYRRIKVGKIAPNTYVPWQGAVTPFGWVQCSS